MKQAFRDYVFATNTDGSGKASSYIRALDMLGPILTKHYPKPVVNGSMWHSFPVADIEEIYRWVCREKRKGSGSPVLSEFDSPSYWTRNFCSAAIRAYGEFMAAEQFENSIVSGVSTESSGRAVAQRAKALIERTSKSNLERHLNLSNKDGKEKLAFVKVRVNQDIFRKLVLANFDRKCCVTGLDVPAVLQASHISAWETDVENRLNPENGLCLSATYHEAFDSHLISIDEHYRLIVSKSVKDHFSSAAAKAYFLDREGQRIFLPTKYLPSQAFLSKHRDLLVG